MKKHQNSIVNSILIMIFLAGLSVMLYPAVSDLFNSRLQKAAIADYDSIVEKTDDSEKQKIFEEAEKYNEALSHISSPFTECDSIKGYREALDISGTGIMGYITIPKIRISFPIYHGTDKEVLNVAAGHLEGSALPVGGENRNPVISAHRGLPSAKLFSDLDMLQTGDTFTITIIDTILTYEVEQINIVRPEEVNFLYPVKGKDLVTLMTCTPYGVNSHRLLVRAHRIDTIYPYTINVPSDAVQTDSMVIVPVIAAPLMMLLVAYWVISSKIRRKTHIDEKTADELIYGD